VPGLFADQVWRWVSSQVPLSNQSDPRVGTTISSVLTSLTPQYSPSPAVFRSPAYTPARAASASPSVWKKLLGVMELIGVSVRSVHPCMGTRSSVQSPTAPIDVVTKSRFMDQSSLERDTEAARECPGPGIGEIIDAERRQPDVFHVGRVHARHLGVEPRITRDHEQIVGRHVQASTPRRAGQDRQVERVLQREILEAEERRPLDPAGREDGRLVEGGPVGQGGSMELLVLPR